MKAIVVAGGHGQGAGLHQLDSPLGVEVSATGVVIVSDTNNHRVVTVAAGAGIGEVVAGGSGVGSGAVRKALSRSKTALSLAILAFSWLLRAHGLRPPHECALMFLS